MKPKVMMVLGVCYGILGLLSSLFYPELAAPLFVLAWSSGSMFGKGYGVWECRQALKGKKE